MENVDICFYLLIHDPSIWLTFPPTAKTTRNNIPQKPDNAKITCYFLLSSFWGMLFFVLEFVVEFLGDVVFCC